MKCAYHPDYRAYLPPSHPYPMGKYPLLKDKLLEAKLIDPADLLEPDELPREVLELVHSGDYLDKLYSAALSPAEIRRLGLPWTDALWLRSRLASGGTLLAARVALQTGLAANLAGGTHHAFADHAEGFCVLNDVALATVALRVEGRIRRAAIVDLDVHQGNGTAAIFEHVEEVFTFSMHGEHNYPARKMRSDLDVPLRDGLGDADYLEILERHLPQVLDASRPDVVFYVAGVDVAAGDRYGRLALSAAGIGQRDRSVIEAVRGRHVPLVIVLGGGYAATPERTAQLHVATFEQACAYEQARGRTPRRP